MYAAFQYGDLFQALDGGTQVDRMHGMGGHAEKLAWCTIGTSLGGYLETMHD